MNIRNLFYLGIIIITCILLLAVIMPPASAYTYVLAQGDKAYQGDNVDLSLTVAWPDYQLAWCAEQVPGCANPIITDTSDFNQHHVYLDNSWKVGMYYRWSGQWNRGENQDAFEILYGPRPANITVVEHFNKSVTADTITPPAKSLPNSTHILIARGDDVEYQYAVPNITAAQSGYIWLFGESKGGIGSQILGEPLKYRGNDSVYSYYFDQKLSESLTEGLYTGYLQFTGKNGFQDVFYRSDHNVDGDHVSVLDTPYDDDTIPDVPLDGFIPIRIQQEFEQLEKPSQYSDDVLIPISMSVEQPSIFLTEYYELNDTLIISGKTTMSAGTTIVFKLDPDHYALKYDIMAHTWSTGAEGLIDTRRAFNISLPINWDDLAISNHTILATIDKNRIHTETHKDFKVSDVFIFPTPTPAREKVVLEDYGWHRVTPNATPTITTTPKPAPTPSVTVNVTVSPVNTTAVPTTRPTPKPTEAVTVPLSAAAGILALAGVALWRKAK